MAEPEKPPDTNIKRDTIESHENLTNSPPLIPDHIQDETDRRAIDEAMETSTGIATETDSNAMDIDDLANTADTVSQPPTAATVEKTDDAHNTTFQHCSQTTEKVSSQDGEWSRAMSTHKTSRPAPDPPEAHGDTVQGKTESSVWIAVATQIAATEEPQRKPSGSGDLATSREITDASLKSTKPPKTLLKRSHPEPSMQQEITSSFLAQAKKVKLVEDGVHQSRAEHSQCSSNSPESRVAPKNVAPSQSSNRKQSICQDSNAFDQSSRQIALQRETEDEKSQRRKAFEDSAAASFLHHLRTTPLDPSVAIAKQMGRILSYTNTVQEDLLSLHDEDQARIQQLEHRNDALVNQIEKYRQYVQETDENLERYKRTRSQRAIKAEIQETREQLKKLRKPDVTLESMQAEIDRFERRLQDQDQRGAQLIEAWAKEKKASMDARISLKKDYKLTREDKRNSLRGLESDVYELQERIDGIQEQLEIRTDDGEHGRENPVSSRSIDSETYRKEVDEIKFQLTETQEGIKEWCELVRADITVLQDHIYSHIKDQLDKSDTANDPTEEIRDLKRRYSKFYTEAHQAHLHNRKAISMLQRDAIVVGQACYSLKKNVNISHELSLKTAADLNALIKELRVQAGKTDLWLRHMQDRVWQMQDVISCIVRMPGSNVEGADVIEGSEEMKMISEQPDEAIGGEKGVDEGESNTRKDSERVEVDIPKGGMIGHV